MLYILSVCKLWSNMQGIIVEFYPKQSLLFYIGFQDVTVTRKQMWRFFTYLVYLEWFFTYFAFLEWFQSSLNLRGYDRILQRRGRYLDHYDEIADQGCYCSFPW